MSDRNRLTRTGMLQNIVGEVASRVCEIIEEGSRPSQVEEVFMSQSAALNDRIEQIGHVYATAYRLGLPRRVLEAESILGEVIYCFRKTLTVYDAGLTKRIDAFLRDELIDAEVPR